MIKKMQLIKYRINFLYNIVYLETILIGIKFDIEPHASINKNRQIE